MVNPWTRPAQIVGPLIFPGLFDSGYSNTHVAVGRSPRSRLMVVMDGQYLMDWWSEHGGSRHILMYLSLWAVEVFAVEGHSRVTRGTLLWRLCVLRVAVGHSGIRSHQSDVRCQSDGKTSRTQSLFQGSVVVLPCPAPMPVMSARDQNTRNTHESQAPKTVRATLLIPFLAILSGLAFRILASLSSMACALRDRLGSGSPVLSRSTTVRCHRTSML